MERGGCSRVVNLLLLVQIIVAATQREAFAAKHVVGGSGGWDASTDFDSWASAQTFKVGDELEFKYTPLHSVVELSSESAYRSCDIGSAVKSLNGGSNTIKLDKPNTRYFACGTFGHCEQGMKVKIRTTTTQPSSHSTYASFFQLQFLGNLYASLLVSFLLGIFIADIFVDCILFIAI